MKKQFDERNLTMVMDFYELTMANGYFKDEAEVNRYYELYGDGGGEILGVRQGTTTGLRPGDTKRLDLNGDNKIDAASGIYSFSEMEIRIMYSV